MNRDPDVYDGDRLHSPNGGLSYCEDLVVEVVLSKGTDTLKKWFQEALGGLAGQKAARFADILLADFVRHRVFEGFQELEASMRAAFTPFAERHQKLTIARVAAEEAAHAWGDAAADFRPKLNVLGRWAQSAARARIHRVLGMDPNPLAYATLVGTSSWLKTPDDFVKYRDSFFREINFIRELSEYEVIEGRLERPVGMSDFESSLRALEAAQVYVEARQDEEAKAKAALDSARLKYCDERHKAVAVLQPLSEAGKWALFRLVSSNTESAEHGITG